ncbi:uncharacterized protein HMPREF1541_07683 [Cyphellophora europaea CBS 101466]|uniref:Carboxylic ester hydrolase n=1 Tax=Cyphellophora europaea (strain CBS 101466) TaxID=1220924 RepID=W2RQR4_CYPE1|nr:uncharacterized protein HMPREF1541_07683 [Cyphellophora europaea CBS 101466]ETN38059.1 hypothetical protein HMPREF1541_07683 [Cyphellophora europaea CBS 101466]
MSEPSSNAEHASAAKSDAPPPPATVSTDRPSGWRRRLLEILGFFVVVAVLAWNRLPDRFFKTEPLLVEGYTYCRSAHFSAQSLRKLPGIQLLGLHVAPVYNYTAPPTPERIIGSSPYFKPKIDDLSFCNVTYVYTHPGYNNRVSVQVFLPSLAAWNGRFQGAGGGGYFAGLGGWLSPPAVAAGYAVASTDGGLLSPDYPPGNPSGWATTADGLTNWNYMHVFGPLAIADMTRIGQAITRRYYELDRPNHALKSYFNGCSTGGRQGLMIAQHNPELYDGILATAPAVDYATLLPADYHAQHFMTVHDTYPQPCELEFITAAAIEECDPLDGVTDGLISRPDLCNFSPLARQNTIIPCPAAPNKTTTLSPFAARLAHEIWAGPHSLSGHRLHPGLMHETPLTPLAGTSCNYTTTPPTCHQVPWSLPPLFIQNFLLKKPLTVDPAITPVTFPQLSYTDFLNLFKQAILEYRGVISATSPDLSGFSRAPQRPKMITWHGLADQLIAANHSLDYYKSVLAHFADNRADYAEAEGEEGEEGGGGPREVSDFYRYYSVPGVYHCSMGPGPYPGSCWDSRGALDQLVKWVEDGVVPETLDAVSDIRDDVLSKGGDGRIRRPICTWPKVASWKGGKEGNWWDVEGWECVD